MRAADDFAKFSEVVSKIHSRWTDYETFQVGRYDTPERDKFLGALDALWDMDDALRGVWGGLPENKPLAKLVAYGTLQALVIQQDSVGLLNDVVLPERRWSARQVPELDEIRTLRHRLSGHIAYAAYSGRTASIIDVSDRRMIAGTIYGLNHKPTSERFPRFPIQELIGTNSRLLAAALEPVSAALEDVGAVFLRLRRTMGGG